MGRKASTACDSDGLFWPSKIWDSIDTLKVTLQKQCFYFLSAVKNKNIAAHYKKDQVFFILNNRWIRLFYIFCADIFIYSTLQYFEIDFPSGFTSKTTIQKQLLPWKRNN